MKQLFLHIVFRTEKTAFRKPIREIAASTFVFKKFLCSVRKKRNTECSFSASADMAPCCLASQFRVGASRAEGRRGGDALGLDISCQMLKKRLENF
jgi:hypothetical protein